MRVFCPNCGTSTETNPGAKVTCASCAAVFEAPGEGGAPVFVPPPVGTRPAESARGPDAPFPSTFPARPASVPMVSVPRGGAGAPAATHPWAIVSLVFGIICCIPLVSPALAIGGGVKALGEIDRSNGTQGGRGLAIAGIILGGLTALSNLATLLSAIFRR